METVAVRDNLTGIVTGARVSCEQGQCRHDVLMSSPESYSIVLQFAVEVLRQACIPTVLSILCYHLWACYVTCSRDVTSKCPLPPGGFGLPLVGETLHMLLMGRRYFESRRNAYGRIYKTHLFGKPTIRVIGSENVKQILRGENTLVTTAWPRSTCILLGEGCISHATGAEHVSKKKTIMKSFTYKALSNYVPVIQETTRSYIKDWCQRKNILGYVEFKLLTFDLSCRLLASFQMDQVELKHLMGVFETFLSNVFSVPVDVPGSGFRKGLRAREELLQKIGNVINERGDLTEKADILSIIMEQKDSENLTIDEVKNLCLELLFAGHGTTSSASCYLVLELARHPEVRNKIRAEMTSVGLHAESYSDDLDMQKLSMMPYLNNVIKEALRMCPPVGGGFRKALKTFEINGYQVPKDWTVTYAIRDTHETSTHFTDPDQFNPDRWNNSTDTDNRFQYLPFGGGRRICAGKDLAWIMLKIFALELLRGCEWHLGNEDTTFRTFPVPCPLDNLPLVFSSSERSETIGHAL